MLFSKHGGVEERSQTLSHILFNQVHILDRLRSHQARQTLIALLKEQAQTRNEQAEQLEKYDGISFVLRSRLSVLTVCVLCGTAR